MNWSALYLVKEAMRLRQRVRAGLVSPTAMERLNAVPKPAGMGPERPILPQPARVTAGLERGNQNLMKRYNIIERLASEHETGGVQMPMMSLMTDPDLVAKHLPSESLAKLPPKHRREVQEELDEGRYFGHRQIKTMPLNRAKAVMRLWDQPDILESVPVPELAAVNRRHEIDEIRETLRLHRQGKPLEGQTTHASPQVVSREGENVSMLSPATQKQQLFERIGTGDLGLMLNKDPRSLTGPYGWLRETPSAWLAGQTPEEKANWHRNINLMRQDAEAGALKA
jgi:hypothetical protein